MVDIPPLSLRQIRVIAAVAQQASLIRASEQLNLSQSSLSRTITEAERALDCRLFQRGWAGMAPTSFGAIVIPPCARMIAFIESAQGVLGGKGRLDYYLTWQMLDAVEAVNATGSTLAAALYLGISQPAISRLLSQLADVLGRRAFQRVQGGMRAGPDVALLCDLRARLLVEALAMPDALSAMRGETTGRIEVGILPFSEQDIVVRAFSQILRDHHHVRLQAVTGSYGALTDALMKGSIDFILGPLRSPSPFEALEEITLFDEWLTIVARQDHPLAGGRSSLQDLISQNWVIGPRGTPPRQYFEDLLAALGLSLPPQICEMVTFYLAEQMVLESGALGLLTFSAAKLAALPGGLVALDVDLPEPRRRIGLTVRRNQPLTAAQEIFLDLLQRDVACQF